MSLHSDRSRLTGFTRYVRDGEGWRTKHRPQRMTKVGGDGAHRRVFR